MADILHLNFLANFQKGAYFEYYVEKFLKIVMSFINISGT